MRRGGGQQLGDAQRQGHAPAAEQRGDLPVGGILGDGLRREQQPVRVAVAEQERRIARQRVQRRGDQRRGVVVEAFVVQLGRACRVLVGRRAQLRAPLPGEGGQVGGVEVDRVQPAVRADDDVFGFQVAVRPLVGKQLRGQAVECRRQVVQSGALPGLCRPAHDAVERFALDPVVEHDVGPDPVRGGFVEVEFALEQPCAVDFTQVARRPQVTAQGADAARVADAEDRGAVAHRDERTALGVAAQFDLAQRAGQAARIGERGEVLAQQRHERTVSDPGPSTAKRGSEKPRLPKTARAVPCEISGSSGRCGRGRRSRSRGHRSRSRHRSRGRRTSRRSSGPAGPRASRRAPRPPRRRSGASCPPSGG